MKKYSGAKDFFINNWLLLIIALQPVLDAVAYFNSDSFATISGYLRLLLMLALPLYLLISLKKKKGFIILMAVMGLFSLLHMLNCLRLGYIDFLHDTAYLVRVLQTPVLTVCFVYLMRDENTKNQAKRGIFLAAGIFVLLIIAALLTGTWNSTYGGGLGLSGWVIDDNRCANSIITVTLAVFAVLAAAVSERKSLQLLLPCLTAFFLIANGTKACYLGLFAILLGYGFFMLLQALLKLKRIKGVFLAAAVLLSAAAVLVYPYSPRAKVDSSQGNARSAAQIRFEQALEENGYSDVDSMSLEEKMADPLLKSIYFDYYVRVFGDMSDIYDRFGMDRVFIKYGMSSDINRLADTRILKTSYASLIWDDCDFLTRLLGFESSQTVINGMYDMENDYPALFYYYGYLGFGLYMLFLLYFVFIIIKRLIKDFKGSLSMENFSLLLCLMLQLGLAQFSGALIRRPNVSIYLCVILALIYYQTEVLPLPAGGKEELK